MGPSSDCPLVHAFEITMPAPDSDRALCQRANSHAWSALAPAAQRKHGRDHRISPALAGCRCRPAACG